MGSEPFNTRLGRLIREKDSMVCIGLDLDPGRLPDPLWAHPDPLFEFARRIIDATCDLVVAYKPNLAFYEAMGPEGWRLLQRIVRYIPEGLLKIGDGKRGDIGSTAVKYAEALSALGFDAVTVNPYLGKDAIVPFIRDPHRGAFVLCLTSNPGSGDFQMTKFDGTPLFLHVAEKVWSWNTLDNLGLVVGATHPEAFALVRSSAPDLPFLVPGVGAQGGDLEAAVLRGVDAEKGGLLINVSRSVLYAASDASFAEAARQETRRLRAAIQACLNRSTGASDG